MSSPYGGKECITYGVPKGAGSDIFLYECSSCLGLPVNIPHYEFFRIAVITWILFSFIITVAYKSSISSKLTVPQDDPEIQSFEELIRSPLQLTGYNNMYRLLEYNGSEPTIKKMAQKFQITDFNIEKAVTYISTERKIAYMGHTSMFLYYALINPLAKGNIYVMTDCILSYYPSVMLKKHSPFLIQLDMLVNRLKESGITSKWRSEYIFKIPPPPRTFLKLSNDHIYDVHLALHSS
ncbi:hypothetical protein Phum_PHUM380900 [Pediculus humanus corporis]|uniref:Uncharacterized protein n=1 Tax=Pediculus humanus subsp. corporis TaxID=121224 RepID=E0VQP8_PEDHC|nr:uncharacterized protein Phum_PHUM380900 [Pediculus humanus corporis]EEB15704.1 hypothetical protein Phum_PHUM380900 [Pediculus humanus corporis]